MSTIAERLAEVKERMEAAASSSGRTPDEIRLLAVSKRQPIERLRAVYDLGVRDFGENYVQALQERRSELPEDVRWHFIGHLQSNKAKRVAWCHLVHALDGVKAARLAGNEAELLGRTLPCLIHVNISEEDSKSGLVPNAVEGFIEQTRALPGVELAGLMCIPDPGRPPQDEFRRTRELRDRLATATGLALPELSMGMSSSFEAAIAEGATIVRVGTRIFGPRDG